MKKVLAFLSLSLALGFAGCDSSTGSDNASGSESSSLVGTWKSNSANVFMTFQSNGKVVLTDIIATDTSFDTGTWKVSGTSLTLILNGDTATGSYVISGSTLAIAGGKLAAAYTKVSTSPSPSTDSTTTNTSSNSSSSASSLVGTWKSNSANVFMTFQSNGKVVLTDIIATDTSFDTGTWKVSGTSLTLILNGDTATGSYVISGSTLAIAGGKLAAAYTKVSTSPSPSTDSTTTNTSSNSSSSASSLVGTWKNTSKSAFVTFQSNGKVVLTDIKATDTSSDTGTWKVSGTSITLILNGETINGNYVISDSTLAIVSGKLAAAYTKVSTSPSPSTGSTTTNTGSNSSSSTSPLVGTWKSNSDNVFITFQSNGVAIVADIATDTLFDTGTWKASGTRITLSLDGDAGTWNYVISGGTLTIVSGNQTLTYTKVSTSPSPSTSTSNSSSSSTGSSTTTTSSVVGIWMTSYVDSTASMIEKDVSYITFSSNGTYAIVDVAYYKSGSLAASVDTSRSSGTWTATSDSIYLTNEDASSTAMKYSISGSSLTLTMKNSDGAGSAVFTKAASVVLPTYAARVASAAARSASSLIAGARRHFLF